MSELSTLKEIIDLMTLNKLSLVKFGDIEIRKDIHEVKQNDTIIKTLKPFEELTEDEQLFQPTVGIK